MKQIISNFHLKRIFLLSDEESDKISIMAIKHNILWFVAYIRYITQ